MFTFFLDKLVKLNISMMGTSLKRKSPSPVVEVDMFVLYINVPGVEETAKLTKARIPDVFARLDKYLC